jgi:hypothetical protein
VEQGGGAGGGKVVLQGEGLASRGNGVAMSIPFCEQLSSCVHHIHWFLSSESSSPLSPSPFLPSLVAGVGDELECARVLLSY